LLQNTAETVPSTANTVYTNRRSFNLSHSDTCPLGTGASPISAPLSPIGHPSRDVATVARRMRVHRPGPVHKETNRRPPDVYQWIGRQEPATATTRAITPDNTYECTGSGVVCKRLNQTTAIICAIQVGDMPFFLPAQTTFAYRCCCPNGINRLQQRRKQDQC
jgi:hypothetical protein